MQQATELPVHVESVHEYYW